MMVVIHIVLRKTKIVVVAIMAICIVKVGYSLSYNDGKDLNGVNSNGLKMSPDLSAVPSPPVINSVNSTANPAYVNELVNFTANVN